MSAILPSLWLGEAKGKYAQREKVIKWYLKSRKTIQSVSGNEEGIGPYACKNFKS